jgi:hypothetical protein
VNVVKSILIVTTAKNTTNQQNIKGILLHSKFVIIFSPSETFSNALKW